MAASLFTKYRFQNGAPFLQDKDGQAWLESLGAIDDGLIDDAIAAAKCGFPDKAPLDALPKIGTERGIERGPFDTDAIYGKRLREAWEAWQRAGSGLAILLALEAQSYTAAAGNPVLVQQNGLALSLDADTTLKATDRLLLANTGTNPAIPASADGKAAIAAGTIPWWTFDGSMDGPGDQYNGRFGVIFQNPLPAGWTSIVAPPTAGSAPTKNEVNTIIRTVRQWKAAKAKLMWIRVKGATTLMWGFPTTQKWADPGLLWGGGGGAVVEWTSTEYA